jgi:hypothetical protein
MKRIAMAAAFTLPVSLWAQWLNYREPGVPRLKDGFETFSFELASSQCCGLYDAQCKTAG